MGDWPDGQEHLEIPAAIETQEPKELEHRLIAHVKSGHDLVLQHLLQHAELLEPAAYNGATAST